MSRRPIGYKRQETISQKFGRLLVLNYEKEVSEQRRHAYYLCRCDCGKELVVSGNFLRTKHTKSCGCLRQDTMREIRQQSQFGEKNSNYLYGFTAESRKFKKIVRARDRTCQHDGEHKGRLEVHHLDGNRYNNDPKNGSLLCRRHHVTVR